MHFDDAVGIVEAIAGCPVEGGSLSDSIPRLGRVGPDLAQGSRESGSVCSILSVPPV
jgi:hypothetical protein